MYIPIFFTLIFQIRQNNDPIISPEEIIGFANENDLDDFLFFNQNTTNAGL